VMSAESCARLGCKCENVNKIVRVSRQCNCVWTRNSNEIAIRPSPLGENGRLGTSAGTSERNEVSPILSRRFEKGELS
jgi:hypothetical protein